MSFYQFIRLLHFLGLYQSLLSGGIISLRHANYYVYYRFYLANPSVHWIDAALLLGCGKTTYFKALQVMSQPLISHPALQRAVRLGRRLQGSGLLNK